jgi:hypothetical protein
MSEKVKGIEANSVRENEEKARVLFSKLDALLLGKQWLLDLEEPTALDAHAVILIARLKDVGRANLVPYSLLAYADAAFTTSELQGIMNGRRTMIQRP